MRMLKSLAVAAMLMAVAAVATPHASEAAAASQQAAAVSRKAIASIGHKLNDFESVPRHMRKLRKAAHGLHRAFSAKQASSPAATCDQAGFADATARVLQACPSLSGLVSGATSLEEFLPGFCGSECYVALSEELVRHAACVDETTAFLLEFVYTCQVRPQCFSEGFIVGGARLEARCGVQIEALFDITNVTDAARADAALACSGTCAADQSALVRTYGACLGSDMNGPAVAAALDYMCTRPSGAASTAPVCGVQLKSFGELQCDEASVCAASSKCGTGCQPALTTANLDAACSGCLMGFLPHLTAFGEDPAEMALGLELYCQKLTPGAPASDSNPYCFPVAMASVTALGSGDGTTSAATACAATGAGACTDRVMGLAADGVAMSADSSFRACLNRTYSVSSCLPSYEAALRAAALTRATGRLACSQNAANGWCWDSAIAWVAASFGCSGCTCQTDLSALLTQTGCCAPKVNDFLQVTLDYPATYLPAGQQSMRVRGSGTFTYTHTARYSRTMLTRADLAFHGAVSCIGNSSEQWAIVESPCPTTLASPPAAEFPVTLAWERVSANPALKAELEQSLQADTARNLGVRSSQIVNGSLQQGTGQVQLRTSGSASASAGGRRQTASTGANCAYRFQVDAATEAEATAAVQALQAKQNNGTFVTPSTSRTATSKCTECMDARQDSLVNAAAPAPGAAPPAGSPSPAGGVAAALAGAVAAAVAVMAL